MKVFEHYFNKEVVDKMKYLNDRELRVYLAIAHKTEHLQKALGKYDENDPNEKVDVVLNKMLHKFCSIGLLKEEDNSYQFGSSFEDKNSLVDWTVEKLGYMLKELTIREIYVYFWTSILSKENELLLTNAERNDLATAFRMSYPIINRMKFKEAEIGLIRKGFFDSVKKKDSNYHYILSA